jgi:rubrerythrin
MNVEQLIFTYVLATLGAVGLLTVAEMRRRTFGPTPSDDHVFRCEGCGFLYTDDPDVDRSRCPNCGRMNDMFRF